MTTALYILRRCLMMIPTLLGITMVTFLLSNLAPGGPVEQKLQQLRSAAGNSARGIASHGQQIVSEEVLQSIKKQYGFDKPIWKRYVLWLKNVVQLDFGKSFIYGRPALEVIVSRFPVSLQFGLVSVFFTYLVSVTIGIVMARNENRSLDTGLGVMLLAGSSVPSFAFAILLVVFFAGGSFLSLFPIGYLNCENYESMTLFEKILDRAHHFALPTICYLIGSFTALSYLCRNSILDEMNKDYVRTARAKGLTENLVMLKHAFRNALIPVVTGIGGIFSVFLSGSLLIETIFQLDGIGMLGYQSLLSRDYNLIMGLAVIQSLLLLLGNLFGDLVYVFVDPRIELK